MKKYTGLKALVVEDDQVIQTILKTHLGLLGIQNRVVGNGVEAIQALKEEQFDFVLMDVNMPEQDGLDATRWIRDLEKDAARHIPIFALTSFGSREHTQEILDAGMNEHLVKPFESEEFVKLLEKYFPFREKT